MAANRYKTAGAIVNAAAKELGLGTQTDPFASPDANFQKLVQMLNSLGLELCDTYTWQHLLREYTFVTTANQTPYDLPSDFNGLVEHTAWNRTQQMTLGEPLTEETWAHRASTPGASAFIEFRLTTNQILLAPINAVPGSQTIAFEMKSRSWVRPAASGLGNGNSLGTTGTDECLVTGDYPLFEPLLLQYGIKLAWKKDGGFDTTTAEADFLRVLANAQARTKAAAHLYLTPQRTGPLIGLHNLPDTGYGT